MSTTSISLRIDNDLLEYLKQRAENEHRNLSNTIVSIIDNSRNVQNPPCYSLEEIELKPCPLCGREVEWRDGKIMCWCGIMYKNRNYISTVESWNERMQAE